MPFLPPNQQRQSTEGKHVLYHVPQKHKQQKLPVYLPQTFAFIMLIRYKNGAGNTVQDNS